MVCGDLEANVHVPAAAIELKSKRTAPDVGGVTLDDSDLTPTTKQQQVVVRLPEVLDKKLELLQKLIARGSLSLGGAMLTVDVQEKLLRISGNADQIRTAQMNAMETLALVCCVCADVTEKQLQLLTSKRGKRWLEDLLARNGEPVVVLYVKDSTGYVAAADNHVISHFKSVLETSLVTDTIPFGPDLHKFLQSKQWVDVVHNYESTRFLAVTRDDEGCNVVVEGCARAVGDVGVEIRQLLRLNSRVSRKIQLKSGEYRLIKQHQEAEIYQCFKNQRG